jgi:hypothetical protein
MGVYFWSWIVFSFANYRQIKTNRLINKFRPRLSADEAEVLQKYRAIKKASDKIGINDEDVKHGWLKNDKASLFFKNPNFKSEDEQGLEIIKSECIEAVKNHAPKYNQIKFEKTNDSHLLVIDIADLHIGKLASAFEVGEDYNSQIAVKRAKDGMQGILNKSQGFKIDKILFVAGNDILHTDNTSEQQQMERHKTPTAFGLRILLWLKTFILNYLKNYKQSRKLKLFTIPATTI